MVRTAPGTVRTPPGTVRTAPGIRTQQWTYEYQV